MIGRDRLGRGRRRGAMAVEHVMAAAAFMAMAAIVMRFGFLVLSVIHHLIATLVGWPTL